MTTPANRDELIEAAKAMARVRYKWLGFEGSYENEDAAIRQDEESLCLAQLEAISALGLAIAPANATQEMTDASMESGPRQNQISAAIAAGNLLQQPERGEK